MPSPTSTYTKTTQTVENYTLKSGRVYKLEVFGAKGGNGVTKSGNSGIGGNGSHAIGWYDMRTSADATAQIFAGGVGGTNGAGWGATAVATQLQGTPGGYSGSMNGGGGGGASGIYIGATALLVAGGGGGAGGGPRSIAGGGAGGGTNGADGGFNGALAGGKGATQSGHGAGGGNGKSGSASGGGAGGGGGGGAGGGYARGYAGASSGSFKPVSGDPYFAQGGGGSGGASFIGGVQSLKDAAGKASTTWAHGSATGNGKVIITEYIMAVNVASPSSPDNDIYTVSAPSKTSALFGESYTFTVTREIGVGHIGLKLNTPNGTLALTSTNGNVFTYTVSNVQGAITSANFSTTSYNVAKPPDGTGYTISDLSATSVLMGGSYSFVINLEHGNAIPFVTLNSLNGKVGYSGVDIFGNMIVTISNVQGEILTSDFAVTVHSTM